MKPRLAMQIGVRLSGIPRQSMRTSMPINCACLYHRDAMNNVTQVGPCHSCLVVLVLFLLPACIHTYSGYAVDGSLLCAERVATELGYDVVWNDSTSFVASRWDLNAEIAHVPSRFVVRVDSSDETGPRISLRAREWSRNAEIVLRQCGL